MQVKISLLSGVVLGAPIWLYQLWAFVNPALHKKERRTTYIFVVIATPLFVTGVTLAYLILPNAVQILLGFTPNNLSNLVRFDEYLDFVLRLIIIFGLAFILPVFLTALNLLGLISGKSILRPWRIAVFFLLSFYRRIYSNTRPYNYDNIGNSTLLDLLQCRTFCIVSRS